MSIEDLSNVVFTEWTSNRNTDRTRRICLPKVYRNFQGNQCVENFTCIFPPFEPITFHLEQFEDAQYIQWRRNASREPDMAVDQMKTKRRFFRRKTCCFVVPPPIWDDLDLYQSLAFPSQRPQRSVGKLRVRSVFRSPLFAVDSR